jgi:hypothetical protein
MLKRVVTSAFAVMGLALALACGGAEPTDTEQVEGVATEAVSNELAAPIPPGCGAHRQRCCESRYCNSGLECDAKTLTCLY